MLSRYVRLAGAVAAAVVVQTASAAPCAGFTDVDDTSTFCPNVEWLKNRAVTLGCTSSTLYCPGDAVNRLSMAAFMNRLGAALTPVSLLSQDNVGYADLDVETFTCKSAVVAPAPYPRMAVVTGHLSAIATVAPAQWTSWIAWNNDGNGTTFPSANTGQQMRGGPVVANTWGFSAHTTHIFLAANTPLQIAIRVGRDFDVGGTNDLGGTRCILNAVLYNQNGSASPFDVAGDTGPSAVRD